MTLSIIECALHHCNALAAGNPAPYRGGRDYAKMLG